MNLEQDLKSEKDRTEVQTRKRKNYRTVPPLEVSDVEDSRCYQKLLERMYQELTPQNVLQEGDLMSLAQLRWSAERANHLIQCEVNHRVRLPLLQQKSDTSTRLMLAYRLCLADKSFNLLCKQHLDTVKAMQTLSARVEKWSTPKEPRSSRKRES